MAEVTAATAAAADLSWPPVTAVGDALGATMTRECADVSEAAAVDGGTTVSVLAAAVAGGASPAVPAAGDRLAAITAVASAIGTHAAARLWVPIDMVARGGCRHSPPCSSPCPCHRPADGAASGPPLPPPPPPPPSSPVLAAQAAVVAALCVAARGSEAA